MGHVKLGEIHHKDAFQTEMQKTHVKWLSMCHKVKERDISQAERWQFQRRGMLLAFACQVSFHHLELLMAFFDVLWALLMLSESHL